MDSQTSLKYRLSRLLSFASCKSCHVSDSLELPVSKRQPYHMLEPLSPKPRSSAFPICCLKHLETNETCMRQRGTERYSLLCPPVSPAVGFDSWQGIEREKGEGKGRELECNKKKNKRTHMDNYKGKTRETEKDKTQMTPTRILNDWSTTDDEVDTDDDKMTLFSSSSSDSYPPSHHSRSITNNLTAVREGIAVVKRSNDPYIDFRNSMVEMIIEKQIFGARELEELLQTFLSLNTSHHHKVIVEVFSEIWEAIFCDK